MYGLFVGVATLDVAQLTAEEVAENQKVTSLDQMLAAGGPATNAAVVFSKLSRTCSRLVTAKELDVVPRGANPGGALASLLVTAIGDGPAASLILEDLEACDVAVVDCTDYDAHGSEVEQGVEDRPDLAPAISNIMVNAQNGARTVASTNSRLPLRPEFATSTLEAMGAPQVLLVDGHNPQLALATLELSEKDPAGGHRIGSGSGLDSKNLHRGVSDLGGEQRAGAGSDADGGLDLGGEKDLDAGLNVDSELDLDSGLNVESGHCGGGRPDRDPGYLRILDSGSWKPWLPSLLGYIDVAIVSADFMPPGATCFEDVVDFLRGFGIERVICTAGANPVRWSWLGREGEVQPPTVDVVCTLAAGDTFHGGGVPEA